MLTQFNSKVFDIFEGAKLYSIQNKLYLIQINSKFARSLIFSDTVFNQSILKCDGSILASYRPQSWNPNVQLPKPK
jgi:hypothetical protein